MHLIVQIKKKNVKKSYLRILWICGQLMTIYTHLLLKNKMHTYPAEVHFLSFNIAQVTVLILPGVEIPVVSINKFINLKFQ